MRPSFFCLAALLLFAACSSSKEKTIEAISLNKDSLHGNWIMVKIRPVSDNKQVLKIMQSAIQPLKDYIELSVLTFQPDGTLRTDEGDLARHAGKWSIDASKHLVLTGSTFASHRNLPFTVSGFRNDSLIIENILGEGENQLHITYTLKRIKRSDSIPDIFTDSGYSWRYAANKHEDDATIRLRMKKMLAWYSAYFAHLLNNKVSYFNTEKILCPLIFYQGAMGLKHYDKSDKWTMLFYDNKDARKAHQFLQDAFDRYDTYPDRGNNYVQEYIIALQDLSEKI